MKIALPVKQKSPNSDPVQIFGSSAWIMLINLDNEEVDYVEGSDGGTAAARLMAENQVELVLTSKMPDAAARILSSIYNINYFEDLTDTAEVLIQKYLSGNLNGRSLPALVVYDTFMNSTQKMAQAVAEGLDAPCIRVTDISATEIEKYDTVIVGTPIHILSPTEKIRNMLSTVKFNKIAFFCLYTFIGDVGVLELMKNISRYNQCLDTISFKGTPLPLRLSEARKFGERIASLSKGIEQNQNDDSV